MNWIIQNITTITAVVGGLVTVGSLIVRLTPTHDDDAWYQRWVIDPLGRFGLIRDNGDGSYSAKIPVLHSAAPVENAK